MANYFATKTAKFKPFSYQEMLAPVKAYQDAYNALETEMSNLDILANSIKSKLNPNDPEDAKKLKEYEAFQSEMDSAMNNFYNSGYNSDTRKKLNALKVQYAEKLDPINQAYERRIKDADFIRQHRITNPNLIVEGVGSSTSAYMYGNTPSPTVVNLNTVSEAAKNASAGLSKQFVEQIGLQSVEGYIGRYLMHGVKKGIDSNMISEFTNYIDSIKKDKTGQLKTPQGLALYNMFEQIRTANNYDNLSKESKDRLDASIIQGLVSGAAADEDVKYMADNYWDVQAKQASINYNKARMQSLRDKGNSGTGSTDLDLRTNTTIYTGKNFDVAKIANLMGEQFKEPIEYNGTKIYDPIQAYNIIHKDDVRIAELANRLDRKEFVVRNAVGNIVDYDSWGFNKSVYVGGKLNEALTKSLREYEQLVKQQKEAYDALDGIALTDKEVARIRDYSKSSSTGMLTQDELSNFATVLVSDFSTYSGAEKTATIFSQTNSKDGLEDMVKTISNNVMQEWQKGHALKITTSEGKEIKDKEFEKLIDSKTGALDSSKISSIELDFIAAEKGAVKLVTTDGKVYYVDADYIGDQSKAFMRRRDSEGRAIGLFDKYEDLMKGNVSKTVKAQLLNNYLSQAADAIQPQFVHNRQKGMKETMSDEYLFEQANINLLDEE
jgi:hypothetical protein